MQVFEKYFKSIEFLKKTGVFCWLLLQMTKRAYTPVVCGNGSGLKYMKEGPDFFLCEHKIYPLEDFDRVTTIFLISR